jgi:tRNA(fMet)-specific endonuclease VapC
MRYALDTNIISYWLKGLYNLERKIETELDVGNPVIIPPVSYYEIMRGLYADNSAHKLRLFESMCEQLGQCSMGKSDWICCAQLYAKCRKNGQPMNESDLLHAGFCLRRGYVFVTHNTRHFSHIADLMIVDWVEE